MDVTAAPGPTEPRGALHGIRVLDLTSVIMGPYSTAVLGDLGADVTKVEQPGGDMLRGIGPRRSPSMSGSYLTINRNKRSIVVDLKHPEGLALLLRLVGEVDVVVTNIRPSARERLGLTHAALSEVNPTVIFCTAQAFRSDSAERNKPAYDDIVQARSGLTSLFAPMLHTHAYTPFVIADKVCGLTMANAILAALVHRERTGRGQWIDVPMVDTMMSFTLIEHLNGHAFRPPLGEIGWHRVLTQNRYPQRSADGWVCLLPYSDRNWLDFLTFAGRPEVAADPRFATIEQRHANMAELMELVGVLAARQTTAQWLAFCADAGIPASQVLELDDILDDPYAREGGIVRDVEHPEEGPYVAVGHPVIYSDSPATLRRHAAQIGADTREVLTDFGFQPAEIDRLIKTGAAGCEPPQTAPVHPASLT